MASFFFHPNVGLGRGIASHKDEGESWLAMGKRMNRPFDLLLDFARDTHSIDYTQTTSKVGF
jgi:hypothetical protein